MNNCPLPTQQYISSIQILFDVIYILFIVEWLVMIICMTLLLFGIHTYFITNPLSAFLLLTSLHVTVWGVSYVAINSRWRSNIYLLAVLTTFGLGLAVLAFPELLVPIIGTSHLHTQ